MQQQQQQGRGGQFQAPRLSMVGNVVHPREGAAPPPAPVPTEIWKERAQSRGNLVKVCREVGSVFLQGNLVKVCRELLVACVCVRGNFNLVKGVVCARVRVMRCSGLMLVLFTPWCCQLLWMQGVVGGGRRFIGPAAVTGVVQLSLALQRGVGVAQAIVGARIVS